MISFKKWVIRFTLGACAILAAASLPGCNSSSTGASADLILHNGNFWTVNESQPTAQAVAITGDRFTAIGSDAEILRHQGRNTQVVDLQGAFALPGFVDNHVHFAAAASFLEFNIMAVSSQNEFVDRVRVVTEKLDPGEWIVGGFWGAYDEWAIGTSGGQSREPFSPDMKLIESLTADHPMFIRKFDNSAYAANSAAMRAVGLNPEAPRAKGIKFLKTPEGSVTGVMTGDGIEELFSEKIPRSFSYKRRLQQTRDALAEIRKFGVVSVSDMSDDKQLDIYRDLHQKEELSCRIHFRPHLETWEELAGQGIRIGSGDEWIRLGAVKGHIDGIMGTSSARFFEPYSNDPDNRGRWRRLVVDEHGQFQEGRFQGYMNKADAAGLQLSIHAIGDEANHLLLDYLEEMERLNGKKDRRFRLVHAQVVTDDDLERMGKLGVVAEVQPYHISDDMRWMEERIGHERCRGAYAFRRIQESGAILTFGTDWPGTSAAEYPIDPMLGLYAAVTRQTVAGDPPEGWFPDERISIEDAIRAYTYNSAYANFDEGLMGSIAAGKLADLAVLSRNLLEIEPREILETETLYTVVGGRIVYEKK